jgi:hypothetical protein
VDPVGLARVGGARLWLGALIGSLVLFQASAGSGAPAVNVITLVADRDDDDLNGKADGDEDVLAPAGRVDLAALDPRLTGSELQVISGAEHARVVVDGRPLAWGKSAPPGAALQGISPGVVVLVAVRGAKQESVIVDVIGVGLRDGAKKDVDLTRDHASLERTPPERMEGLNDAPYSDPDALRVVLTLPDVGADALPILGVESVGASGGRIDLQPRVPFELVPCGTGRRCYATTALRFVVDDVDRVHAVTAARSLRAEVGGAIVMRVNGRKMQAIRVLGPRAGAGGPIGRLRATLRPFVMRVAPGDGPAIGGNEAGAVAALRAEFGLAAAMWGQCGLSFGPTSALEVKVAEPPPPHLISFGQDLGLYASGGELRVRGGGQLLALTIAPRSSPERVARQFAQVAEKSGLVAIVSPNARISPGASGSVDVSLRRRDGTLVTIEPASAGAPISTDPTLTVRIGRIDFSNGLHHFGDMDSMAGTLEERTLVKALDDGDPRTIEIIVIPSFSGGGRIGESFIASDLSSVRNVVLLDRAGVRARRSSLTLAHELGHVFLNVPGHPDDYGIDTPTLLMDSDASDASPFGPRRLTLDECARVVRESGPHARLPLLTDWPLTPMKYDAVLKP